MAAPYNPPNKGEDFEFTVALFDTSNASSFKANPTIAAGDFKVDIDNGGLNNLATLPSVGPAGSVVVRITLSAAEMDGDVITIVMIDQTATKEWCDMVICIPTAQASEPSLDFSDEDNSQYIPVI